MFLADRPGAREGDAASHRALLGLLSAAVPDAVDEPLPCRYGAPIKLAPPVCTMPFAETISLRASVAAGLYTRLCLSSAVRAAIRSSRSEGGAAAINLASAIRPVPPAEIPCPRRRGAALDHADPLPLAAVSLALALSM